MLTATESCDQVEGVWAGDWHLWQICLGACYPLFGLSATNTHTHTHTHTPHAGISLCSHTQWGQGSCGLDRGLAEVESALVITRKNEGKGTYSTKGHIFHPSIYRAMIFIIFIKRGVFSWCRYMYMNRVSITSQWWQIFKETEVRG